MVNEKKKFATSAYAGKDAPGQRVSIKIIFPHITFLASEPEFWSVLIKGVYGPILDSDVFVAGSLATPGAVAFHSPVGAPDQLACLVDGEVAVQTIAFG
jgi:hypothetical protein